MSEDARIKQIEGSRIAEKAALFGFGAFLSKVLGFLRDLTIAHTVPLEFSDAWVLAFRIPHFLRRLFSEGFANAFLWGQKQTWVSFTIWVTTWTVLVGTISAVLFAFPALFGLDISVLELSQQLYSGMLIYIWSLGISAYLLALAHQRGHFKTAALVPVLLNLVILSALYLSADLYFRLSSSLSWAGVLQILLLLPQLRGLSQDSLSNASGKNFFFKQQRQGFLYFVQVTFAFCYLQYLGLLTVVFLKEGQIGDLSFYFWAERLLEFPLALISTSFGLAGVAYLATGSREREKYLSHSFKWLLPSVVGLFMARYEVVYFLFGNQQFSASDFQKFVGLLVPLSLLLLMMGLYKMILWILVAQKRMLSVAHLSLHYTLVALVLFLAVFRFQVALEDVITIFVISTVLLTLHSFFVCDGYQEILLEVRGSLARALASAGLMGLVILGLQQLEFNTSRGGAGLLLLMGAGFYLGTYEALKRMIPERGTLG